MTNVLSPKDFPWKKSRYGFAAFFFLSLLAAGLLLRLVLLIQFGLPEKPSAGTIVEMILVGLQRDTLAALVAILPLLFWLGIIRDRWFGKLWHRVILTGGFFVLWSVLTFLLFVEYFFFDEFKSRFNTVAVDYLAAPREVAGNIWASYPVALIVVICLALGAGWVVFAFRYFRQMWFQPTSRRSRFLHLAIPLAICAAAWIASFPPGTHIPNFTGFNTPSLNAWFMSSLQGARVDSNRTLNEIASNGSVSFIGAALTGNLDYAAHYRSMPREEAFARVRRMLASPQADMVADKFSIRRKVAGDPNRPRLNVVILLEESLGSEFFGCLGRRRTLTPEMDKLATEEGWLFTNIYATGNRTVRGFEGVFSSFPPLPGDSIVKRDRSENVETIARVLKRDGYNTLFLYGGRGMLDGMRSYALRNGWDRFLDHNPPFSDDFPNPGFATAWGVCDEEVFARAIEEFRALHRTGKPFLGTVLSVSNHQPYTYPKGRIPEDPDKQRRGYAVKYSDWALGQFFQAAKKEAFWTNTIFVMVADHGARVYGSQEIPIRSYEIPWVVLGPAVVSEPKRIGTLGNSIDVAPTILGLIGRPYETTFFGRDLLREPAENSRALVHHNRSIGMFAHDRMVVFGLQKSVAFYEGNPKIVDLKAPEKLTPEFVELEKDAIAFFQVADELYMNRRFRIDGFPAVQLTMANTNSTRGQVIFTNLP